MAQEQSRFFDYTEENNLEYQAEEFAEYFRTFFSDGVPQLGDNLLVSADGTGMLVQLSYGAAMAQGSGYWLKDNETGVKTLAIAAAHSSHTRIDRVVLRRDKSVSVARVIAVVKSGTPSASPAPPDLTREDNIYELSLAQVRVEPGVVSIAADKVTEERANSAVCGLIEPWSVRNLINQGVKTTDSPTFVQVTADKVIGAVFQ
jgi:hypothetical protein